MRLAVQRRHRMQWSLHGSCWSFTVECLTQTVARTGLQLVAALARVHGIEEQIAAYSSTPAGDARTEALQALRSQARLVDDDVMQLHVA
jgi:hypothetical protein